MLLSSRNSLRAILDDLGEALGQDDAGLADGLLGIVSVLAENASLRRALADTAIDSERKRQVVTALFADQVDARAVTIALAGAGRHWARAQDYVTALEVAGVTAVAAQAQAAGRLGQIEEELFRFSRLIAADHDLDRALESPAPVESKRALVEDLLGGRAAEETLRLASQAAAHPRSVRVSETLDNYSEVLAARQQRSVAEVTVAQPMSAAQQERLAAVLSASYGRQLVLNVQIDPDVVGGVRVQVGDEVMNSTIADRLADARRRLAG